jgi:prevent-host-death family protein
VSIALTPSLPADAGPEAFAEAVGRAERDKERVVLTRDGRPVAALVPIEDVEALEAIEDEYDSRLAEEALAQWEAEGRPLGCTHEELMRKYGIEPDDA